ncbi:hypothetical protein QBC36DRAFT_348556 [Triangularia setosa]|uniref:Uncharacterized protein n=1 Tax=Triangularia setosa TaxID=2587417 RepID=A0AAN6W3M8_9PEZI|nr:hypothetical protein QBC36DRAFT_348556 [Podospora setosa]
MKLTIHLPFLLTLTTTTALPNPTENHQHHHKEPNHSPNPINLALGSLSCPPLNLTSLPSAPVFPWKDGDGPWRWGYKGKHYSKRGCGRTCLARCGAAKATVFWRMFLHPWPAIPFILGKSYNRQRLRSDCNYVCGAFCEYSADISQEEMAAHFGVKLSVQTKKKPEDIYEEIWNDGHGSPARE